MTRLWQCSPVAMRMGASFAADAGVAEDVVGAGGLFHPPGLKGAQRAGASNGLVDAPLLVGVQHEPVVRADLFAHDAAAAEVVGGVAANLELEVSPAFGESFAAELSDLFFAEAEPAGGGGVGGIASASRSWMRSASSAGSR